MLDKDQKSIVLYELEDQLDLESAHSPQIGTTDIKCDSLELKSIVSKIQYQIICVNRESTFINNID